MSWRRPLAGLLGVLHTYPCSQGPQWNTLPEISKQPEAAGSLIGHRWETTTLPLGGIKECEFQGPDVELLGGMWSRGHFLKGHELECGLLGKGTPAGCKCTEGASEATSQRENIA